MGKGRTLFLILIALVMAVLAAMLANRIITQISERNANNREETRNVVISKLVIPHGEKIVSASLSTKRVLASVATENTFSTVEEVEGNIALTKIYPGEIIIKERISHSIQGASLASLITNSKRAVSVRVDDVIGVAGFLLPGNTVDVLASQHTASGTRSRTLLQNIKVLAVDQIASQEKDQPVVVRAVTLELTVEESEILFEAIREGSIQLSLRNPQDDVILPQPEPEPEPEPEIEEVVEQNPFSTVTIIKGTSVDTQRL